LKIPKGGNQNPYIEEGQTKQWSKEKSTKDKQRFAKHKTKDRVTRSPLKLGVNSGSCYLPYCNCFQFFSIGSCQGNYKTCKFFGSRR